MSKDILQTLKETYAKHYILKEFDQKTDLKSINDVIRDINVKLDKSWLNKSERRSGIEKRISEILSSVQIAVDNNDDDALHSILTSEVTPLYAHVRTLERQPQKYMGVSPTIKPAPGSQLFSTADAAAQRTADKKASAAAPKGLAKLAARIAKGKQEQPIVADPDVKIDPAILAEPKQTNLDSLETFIVTNKADISEEGFAFAMNAIQAAKADPSPENIEAAKAAVDTAADG
jgi:hypothetical protein